ncbi:MAG: oligosaccharide flippase family protein [Deltaproteobacteria bacterium]|nr:oligosaccharide flippase family protein [Deltaproteobacteria bacterium]
MSRVKTNFIANLAGSGWTALVGLACTPLYIHFLGMEAYGLVGFYFMLQGVVQILDLGLTPTMNREMARYSALPGKAGEARDFVRTLEVGYWAIGILIGCAVWYGAPYIATHWIKAGKISPLEVRRAVTIMGALAALQWPLTFYQGGLLGLQRQVLLNGITITTATLAAGGALLILWLVSPTVSAFFTWQIAVSLLQVGVTTFALWRSLPGSGHTARFDPGITRNIWGFAAGMSGITITALVLTQLDKVILSKMLALNTFGYYILAGMVGNGLSGLLIAPMFNTIFPRFSALVAAGDEKSLLEMYHGSTQVMAVMILPAAIVISLFSREIMLLWTGSQEIANNTAPIVSILVAGTALNGLMNLPYALQLSHGWTRIGLAINSVFIVTLVPAIILMTRQYGAAGAATVWLGLNSLYMLIGVPLTHRRLLKGEASRWFTKDIGIPLAGSLAIAGIARFIFPALESPSRLIPALLLLLTLLLSALVAAVCTPATRDFISHSILNRKHPVERRT